MTLSAKERQWAVVGLLTNACVWGASWIAFKSLGAQGLHPLWTTAVIYAVATIVFHAVQPAATMEVLRNPTLRAVFFAAGATNICFNTAVALGDVVRVTLLFYLMPVWAALLARWVLGEALSTAHMGRLALGLVGAGLVLWQPALGLPVPASLSDWLGIAGGVFFAANNIFLRKASIASDAGRTQAMFMGGAICSAGLGVALASGGWVAFPTAVGSGNLTAVMGTLALWSILFLMANYGVQYGAARLKASTTALLMLFEVVVAAASAVAMGAAQLRWQELLGGALILAAPFLFHRQHSADNE